MEYSECFTNFWTKYGSTESLKQKGSKRAAYKSWEKVCAEWCKAEEGESSETLFAQYVYRGYDATLRNRKAAWAAKEHVPTMPHCTTYLNQWRFEEEFTRSTSELRASAYQKEKCPCGEDGVIGRGYQGGWICAKCDIEEWKSGQNYLDIKPSLKFFHEKYPRREDESWRMWSIRVLSTMPAGAKLLKRYGIL